MTPVPRQVICNTLNKWAVNGSAHLANEVMRDLRESGYHLVETPKFTETTPVHDIDSAQAFDRRWEDMYFVTKLSTLVDVTLLDVQQRVLDPEMHKQHGKQIREKMMYDLGYHLVKKLMGDRRGSTT